MSQQNTRKCHTCGIPIYGRIDKRFCSDQCRYIENNKQKQQTEAIVLEMNIAMRKNRKILMTLCPKGRSVVRKEVLVTMGFRMDLFTALFVTTAKQIYYLCYDFGFTPLIERGIPKVLIVSRQPYMIPWDPWKYIPKKRR